MTCKLIYKALGGRCLVGKAFDNRAQVILCAEKMCNFSAIFRLVYDAQHAINDIEDLLAYLPRA